MPPNQNNDAIDKWLYDKEVTVYGDIPDPILRFEDSNFPDIIVKRLKENYQFPTTIQSITWPVALTGCDLISIAKTGSGKTLAFILPAIVYIDKIPLTQRQCFAQLGPRLFGTAFLCSRPGLDRFATELNDGSSNSAIVHVMSKPRDQTNRSNNGPAVVVMLPTRELAIQVEEVAKEYGKLMELSVCCCYGGSSRAPQMMALRRGIDICIATPGRLLDFINGYVTNMDRCTFLVLDEADRMLDMGFEPQIRQIVDKITTNRQTLMFSATWPKDVRNLAADFHKDPIHLTVGSLDLAANHNIEQVVEVVNDDYAKQRRLWQILKQILDVERTTKILIFVETKRKADSLVIDMRRNGFPALCIHGDKEQREREWVLAEFKASRNNILVATDVAARGLDVDDIKFVVNFDYPNNSEDYVHRIGRTGRRDKTGTAITFFSPSNSPKARDLIKVLEEAKQTVPAGLVDLANNSCENGYDSRSRGRPYGRGGGGGGGSNSYSGTSFAPTGANRTSFNSTGGGSSNSYKTNDGGRGGGRGAGYGASWGGGGAGSSGWGGGGGGSSSNNRYKTNDGGRGGGRGGGYSAGWGGGGGGGSSGWERGGGGGWAAN